VSLCLLIYVRVNIDRSLSERTPQNLFPLQEKVYTAIKVKTMNKSTEKSKWSKSEDNVKGPEV